MSMCVTWLVDVELLVSVTRAPAVPRTKYTRCQEHKHGTESYNHSGDMPHALPPRNSSAVHDCIKIFQDSH